VPLTPDLSSPALHELRQLPAPISAVMLTNCWMQFARQRAQTANVQAFGTHAQYDRIDVENVNDY